MASKKNLEAILDVSVLSLSKYSKTSELLLDAKDLELIPQINSSCWFTGFLTTLLYSQMTRKEFYKEALKWVKNREEIEKNKFKRFLLFMLNYNYTNPEKVRELFKGKIKPELLLLSHLKLTPELSFFQEKIKKKRDIEIFSCDISDLLGFTILQSLYKEKNDIQKLYYCNGHSYVIKEQFNSPKIIFFFHDKFIFTGDFENIFETLEHIDEHTSGVSTYENEITVYGRTYVLDSCHLSNYNKDNSLGHLICGITYNNQGYIYNGWINSKEYIDFDTHTQINKKTICPLFLRDWKSDLRKPENTAGFCLPKSAENCTNLLPLNPKDLCFDFSANAKKLFKILIYVIKDEEEIKEKLDLKSLLSIKKIVYKSESVSSLIKNFYNLEARTTKELEDLLKKLYSQEIIQILINKTKDFGDLYLILTGELLTEELLTTNKETVLRKIFIGLLKGYISDSKLFKMKLIDDTHLYKHLSKEQLIELLKKDLFYTYGKTTATLKDILSRLYIPEAIKLIEEEPMNYRAIYLITKNEILTEELIETEKNSVLHILFTGLIKEFILNYNGDLERSILEATFNVDSFTLDEIENLVLKIYPNIEINDLKLNTNLYSIMYLILTNERVSTPFIHSDFLRKFYIGLIEIYGENFKNIFSEHIFNDNSICLNMTKIELINLLKKIGYKERSIRGITFDQKYSILLYLLDIELNENKQNVNVLKDKFFSNYLFCAIIKYYIQYGIYIDIAKYTNDTIISNLLELSETELKNLIDMDAFDFKLEDIDLQKDSNNLIKNNVEEYLLFEQYGLIEQYGEKGALILLIIASNNLQDLDSKLMGLKSKTSKGGSYNYYSNLKKIKKQLKTYH